MEVTPQEARRYLDARHRVACDRLPRVSGTAARLQWTSQDVFAVRSLLTTTDPQALPVYETLTRSIALRDGLL